MVAHFGNANFSLRHCGQMRMNGGKALFTCKGEYNEEEGDKSREETL